MMKVLTRILFSTVILLAIAASTQAGYLYVLNNVATPGPNQIHVLRVVEPSGDLALVAPTVYSTTGFGVTGATQASEMLTLDRTGRRLYALNAGSGTIDIYRIAPTNGALSLVQTIDLIAIVGPGPTLSPAWRMLAIDPSGTILLAGDVSNQRLASFRINSDVSSTFTGSFALDADAPTVNIVSLGFSPDNQFVYVGGTGNASLLRFSVNLFAGTLFNPGGVQRHYVPAGADPVGDAVGVRVDSAGRVYTVSIGLNVSDTARVYTPDAASPQSLTFRSQVATGAFIPSSGILHPFGFYVVSDTDTFVGMDAPGHAGNHSHLRVMRINGTGAGTTLTTVVADPVATEANNVGAGALALNHSGRALYVVNSQSQTLSAFDFNTSTGGLVLKAGGPATLTASTGVLTGLVYFSRPSTVLDFDGDEVSDLSVLQLANVVATPVKPKTETDLSGKFAKGLAKFNVTALAPVRTMYAAKAPGFRLRAPVSNSHAFVTKNRGPVRNGGGPVQNDILWHNLRSTLGVQDVDFGNIDNGDDVVPADYDGDGFTDFAYRSAADGKFHIIRSMFNDIIVLPAGMATLGGPDDDATVTADYDGDGKADPAVYSVDNHTWTYLSSAQNYLEIQVSLGQGVFPVPGDFNGDGRADFALQYGTNYYVYYNDYPSAVGPAADATVAFGAYSDVLCPGDYDGDGATDFGAAHAGNPMTWEAFSVVNNAPITLANNNLGDYFVDFTAQADYDGDGITDIAIWNPNTFSFTYVRSSNSVVVGPTLWDTGYIYPTAHQFSH